MTSERSGVAAYTAAVSDVSDICVIGGGIIGMSVARDLALTGRSVTLLERDVPGRQASWAGAGMLPPAAPFRDAAFSDLIARSHALWPDLSAALHEETGLDNGFRRCGGLERAASESQRSKHAAAWQRAGARVRLVDGGELAAEHPAVDPAGCWYYLPDHWQVRNPRHLKALEIACRTAGVDIRSGQTAHAIHEKPRSAIVRTPADRFEAGHVVVAAGAWSQPLLAGLEPSADRGVYPVRGQMLLLRTDVRLRTIVQDGPRYLVPRFDGRLLVGATVEDVGFTTQTTASGLADLLGHAVRLCPALESAEVLSHWAGLRPQCDAGPRLGPVSERVVAACGHFRDGLCLSPVTAAIVRDTVETSRS